MPLLYGNGHAVRRVARDKIGIIQKSRGCRDRRIVGVPAFLVKNPFITEKRKSVLRMEKIDLNGKTILITGAAGFIGANLTLRLLRDCKNVRIVGMDDMNDYYDPALKTYRLGLIDAAEKNAGSEFVFVRGSIADAAQVRALFDAYDFDVVVNLAAQAGVRYSIDHPDVYIASNIIGFYNILEACRHSYDGGKPGVRHLVYASSSSVYGGSAKTPFSTDDPVDHPVSLYAATKKSNELLAHAYSKLYAIPSTGLRFFTVYGPAGRPDMFYYSAAEQLRRGETIRLFNYGDCKRDFTYIDDIVEGVVRVMRGAPEKRTGADGLPLAPYAVYNIGGGNPENLMDFVRVLYESLTEAGVLPADFDLASHLASVPMQPGDVPVTFADASALERDFGFRPKVGIREGLRAFAQWYAQYTGRQDT